MPSKTNTTSDHDEILDQEQKGDGEDSTFFKLVDREVQG